MKLRQIFASIISVLGLSDEIKQKAEAEINKLPDVEIKEEEVNPKKTTDEPEEVPKSVDAKTAQYIQALIDQNKKLEASVQKLLQSETERSNALEEQRKTEFANKVKTTITEAIKAGKIPAKDSAKIERLTKLLEQDFDNTKSLIDDMKPITESGKQATGDGNKDVKPIQFSTRTAKIEDYVKQATNLTN